MSSDRNSNNPNKDPNRLSKKQKRDLFWYKRDSNAGPIPAFIAEARPMFSPCASPGSLLAPVDNFADSPAELTYALQAPVKIFKDETMIDTQIELFRQLSLAGQDACIHCNTEYCPDRFDTGWVRYQLKLDGEMEDRAHISSEEEMKQNPLNRHRFYEKYWAVSRSLYKTDGWTTSNFTYIPPCIVHCARWLYPAPMDCSESDIDFIWSDPSVVETLNKGLKALAPENPCAITPR